MAKLSSFRGGSYLKVADLGNKEHLVQIEAIKQEAIGQDGDQKPKLVAYFRGRSKGLVLNDTNLEVLELGFGPDTDDAIGGQTVLFVDPDVRFEGKKTGGIRIKLPKVVAKEKAAPKESTADFLNDELPDW